MRHVRRAERVNGAALATIPSPPQTYTRSADRRVLLHVPTSPFPISVISRLSWPTTELPNHVLHSPVLLSPHERRDDDVPASLDATVSPEENSVAQLIIEQGAVHLRQSLWMGGVRQQLKQGGAKRGKGNWVRKNTYPNVTVQFLPVSLSLVYS